jgi:hypothetical protein
MAEICGLSTVKRNYMWDMAVLRYLRVSQVSGAADAGYPRSRGVKDGWPGEGVRVAVER